MKKYFLFLAFAGFLFTSCSDNTIVEPVSTEVSKQSVGDLKWLELPPGNRLMKQISASQLITGDVGGKVDVDCVVPSGPFGTFIMKATLVVPPHAFADDQTLLFTVMLDDQTLSATFSPSPMTFKVPLSFDLEYKGIDMSSIDPANLKFAYLAGDGSIQIATYQKLDVNFNSYKISVKSANIEHFSRFGFVQ